MLSTPMSGSAWTESIPALGILILSPLFLLFLFSPGSRLRALMSWKLFNVHTSEAVDAYLTNAHSLLKEGFSKSNIFRMMCDSGYQTIPSPEYANEICRLPSLSFSKIMGSEFHALIAGFTPFAQFSLGAEIFQDAVRMKLTRALEWHDITLKPRILKIVAQLSSRVFLGDQICRNPDWLRITVDYTIDSFKVAEELRLWLKIIRPIVAHFLASCRKIRRELCEAERIITPILEERKRTRKSASQGYGANPCYNDAMEWLQQVAKGLSYDPAAIQLTFSLAAIHTTPDMTTQVIYDLCGKDELVQELKNEVISVLSKEGWKKTAMYKLQLTDSFLKESQRLKPINIVSMRRGAEDNIRLNDGTKIPKGTSLAVGNNWMWDSQFYKNPEIFNPYRFLKMRQTPGLEETHAQLVSPSPEHLGFGLGTHVCPRRFFAANEIKIFLCHMLLKYDFRLADGTVLKHRRYGFALHADPQAKIALRRRREEIVLDDIAD